MKKTSFYKFIGISFVLSSLSMITGCGSSSSDSTGNLAPPIVGPVNNWCPPGFEWQCGGTGANTVFATQWGYYIGEVFKLFPGQVPAPGQWNVGYNPGVPVVSGNHLVLSGTAYWGNQDLDFWDYFFGGLFTDMDDVCDPNTNKPAHVTIYYNGLAGGAVPIVQGTPHVVVTPYGGSGVYFGYDTSNKGGADCLFLNYLTLTRQ